MTIETNSKGFNYVTQLGLLLGLVGAGILLSSLLSTFLLSALIDIPVQRIPYLDIRDLHYVNASKIIQFVVTIVGFLLPAWIFAKIAYKNAALFIGIKNTFTTKQFMLALAILLGSMFALEALSYVNEKIPLPSTWRITFKEFDAIYDKQIAAFTKMNNVVDLLIALILMALTPAVVEEILFRGCVQNIFIGLTKKPWVGILITSILFSAIHLSWSGFLARAFLGVVLGLLYYYSKSIWLSITAHALFNGFQIITVYFNPSFALSSTNTHIEITWLNSLALGIVIILLFFLSKTKQLKSNLS